MFAMAWAMVLRRGSSASRSWVVRYRVSPLHTGSSRTTAPPAWASTLAFLSWWWLVTLGDGTITAGLPMAVSSDRVEAPPRHSTRSAATITVGMS